MNRLLQLIRMIQMMQRLTSRIGRRGDGEPFDLFSMMRPLQPSNQPVRPDVNTVPDNNQGATPPDRNNVAYRDIYRERPRREQFGELDNPWQGSSYGWGENINPWGGAGPVNTRPWRDRNTRYDKPWMTMPEPEYRPINRGPAPMPTPLTPKEITGMENDPDWVNKGVRWHNRKTGMIRTPGGRFATDEMLRATPGDPFSDPRHPDYIRNTMRFDDSNISTRVNRSPAPKPMVNEWDKDPAGAKHNIPWLRNRRRG